MTCSIYHQGNWILGGYQFPQCRIEYEIKGLFYAIVSLAAITMIL